MAKHHAHRHKAQSPARKDCQKNIMTIGFYLFVVFFALLALYYSKTDADDNISQEDAPSVTPLHGNVTTGEWQGAGVNIYMPPGLILRRQDGMSPLLTFLFDELFGLMSGKSFVLTLSMHPILNVMAGWLNQTTLSVGPNQYALSYGKCHMPHKLFSEDKLPVSEGEAFDDHIVCLYSRTSQSPVSEVVCAVQLFGSDAVLPMTLFANRSAASYPTYPCAMPAPVGSDIYPTLEVRTMATLWEISPAVLQHYLSSKNAVPLSDDPDVFEDELLELRGELEVAQAERLRMHL